MSKSVVRSEDTRSELELRRVRKSPLMPVELCPSFYFLAWRGNIWLTKASIEDLADPGLPLHQGSAFDWQPATLWPIRGRRLESFVLTQRDKAGDPAVPLATGHDTVEPADTPHSHPTTTTTTHNPPGSHNISNEGGQKRPYCVCLEPWRSVRDRTRGRGHPSIHPSIHFGFSSIGCHWVKGTSGHFSFCHMETDNLEFPIPLISMFLVWRRTLESMERTQLTQREHANCPTKRSQETPGNWTHNLLVNAGSRRTVSRREQANSFIIITNALV